MSIGFGSPQDLGNGGYRVGVSRYSQDGKKFSATGTVVVNIRDYTGDETNPQKQALALAVSAVAAHPEVLVPISPIPAQKMHIILRVLDKNGKATDQDRDFFQPSDAELTKGATTYQTKNS
ncbi:hypothetical protein FP026_08335 [Rhizobium tropici]|uniref:Uncharacterized protein n=1 Tax=Rhizobium tropici TaxID=398 RepID=A0A5B0W9P3_RHITR|nr:hypothetical protein [Rhizobium tropici]KAA1183095.1 hypothetical protein FP026_08335 [Rhizobium tropici]